MAAKETNRRMTGNVLLTITSLVWGLAFVAQRVGMDSIGPVTFTAVRMILAAAAVGLVAFLQERAGRKHSPPMTREENERRRKDTIVGGICCGVFLTAASIFQQIGLVYTTAGKAGFITAMYILLVPVLNFLLFRKKNPAFVWAAVGIGVVGMYLLCINEGFTLTKGDVLECICALFFSCQILSCDRFTGKGNPLTISAIQFLTTAVLAGIAAFIMEEPAWAQIEAAMVPILYCGLVSAGLGYTLQMIGQRYTDPTVASLLMSMESVFALVAGAVILHERLSTRELLGCLVMFIAIMLSQISPELLRSIGKKIKNRA